MPSSELVDQIFSKLIANGRLSEAPRHVGIMQKEEIMRWLKGWPNAGTGKSVENQDTCFSKRGCVVH